MPLDDYLGRLGLARPLPPTLETLRRLHVAHLGAFTFDNLEIQRRGEIRVDAESVERKFLGGLAGGYCFEHNTLFGAVLRELGFPVTMHLGRVGPPDRRSLNHMFLLVDLDGEKWIADVGFGAEGPLEPLPLRDGMQAEQASITYTLHRDAHHWQLSMRCGDWSEPMYEFTDAPHTAGDIEIANYYTATHPASVFRHTLTIQRTTPDERIILRTRMVTRYRDGARTDTPIEPAQIRQLARELFGIDVGEASLLFEQDEESVARVSPHSVKISRS
jgi:N-hydroxyarylamine O-acetyltransferase